ncbi:hypothetical protein ACIRF8_15585 [Streptomyces sp. NPDC102406]|uniref:hypothetical protein n=1 Tax=Streptomyces sp. NPDC102406 TaxID=3366171 RepID=UPI00382BE617
MPIIIEVASVGAITGMTAASPGWRVQASAPTDAGTEGVPAPSDVVAWVLVADQVAPGGARVDPVFLAGGRAWTPDQYRATYGQELDVQVRG